MPVHISNVLEGYMEAQQRVIDARRAWHDNNTPENLTNWVNAMEALSKAPEQTELPITLPQFYYEVLDQYTGRRTGFETQSEAIRYCFERQGWKPKHRRYVWYKMLGEF